MLLSPQYELIIALCDEALLKSATDELTNAIVYFFERHGKLIDLLKFLITQEVKQTSKPQPTEKFLISLIASINILFRGESIATKLLSSFFKKTGKNYLLQIVEPTIQDVITRPTLTTNNSNNNLSSSLYSTSSSTSSSNYPSTSKLSEGSIQDQLRLQTLLASIMNSFDKCPK